MQQKIQSSVGCPQQGKTIVVGELPDVETGSLPVSHIVDTTAENAEIQSDPDHRGISRNTGKARRFIAFVAGIPAKIAIALIRIYQITVSPWIPCKCRFEPSCSRYAAEAFRKRGFFAGCILTAWRLMRCQPFAKSGYDPVPEKGFRAIVTSQNQSDEEK